MKTHGHRLTSSMVYYTETMETAWAGQWLDDEGKNKSPFAQLHPMRVSSGEQNDGHAYATKCIIPLL